MSQPKVLLPLDFEVLLPHPLWPSHNHTHTQRHSTLSFLPSVMLTGLGWGSADEECTPWSWSVWWMETNFCSCASFNQTGIRDRGRFLSTWFSHGVQLISSYAILPAAVCFTFMEATAMKKSGKQIFLLRFSSSLMLSRALSSDKNYVFDSYSVLTNASLFGSGAKIRMLDANTACV